MIPHNLAFANGTNNRNRIYVYLFKWSDFDNRGQLSANKLSQRPAEYTFHSKIIIVYFASASVLSLFVCVCLYLNQWTKSKKTLDLIVIAHISAIPKKATTQTFRRIESNVGMKLEGFSVFWSKFDSRNIKYNRKWNFVKFFLFDKNFFLSSYLISSSIASFVGHILMVSIRHWVWIGLPCIYKHWNRILSLPVHTHRRRHKHFLLINFSLKFLVLYSNARNVITLLHIK